MATEAEIKAIAWTEAPNWARLTRDTKAALDPLIADLRRTINGNSLVWWSKAGALASKMNRSTRTLRIALNRFQTVNGGSGPPWFIESRKIAPKAGSVPGWTWIRNPIKPQATRQVQLARFEVYLRALLASMQVMRRGIEGKPTMTAAQFATIEARSKPEVITPIIPLGPADVAGRPQNINRPINNHSRRGGADSEN